MSNSIQVFNFQGDVLEVVRQGDDLFVSLRAVCGALGVDVESQRKKLAGQPWAVTVMITATGPDGKRYEMTGVHLDTLPLWLATISASKVAEEVRPKLVAYQREAARVLADHFLGRRGVAALTADTIRQIARDEARAEFVRLRSRELRSIAKVNPKPSDKPKTSVALWLESGRVEVIDLASPDAPAACHWTTAHSAWLAYRAWAVSQGIARATARMFAVQLHMVGVIRRQSNQRRYNLRLLSGGEP
jgi:hypothetical protein